VSSSAPRDVTAFEVREALGEPGCAVCRLSIRSVSRLIRSIAYEQVNDVGLRRQLRRAGGFCNAHAYQWLNQAHSVLGTALIYRDVLQAALADINGQQRPRRRGLLGSIQSEEAHCPACDAQAEAEARYLEALLAIAAFEPATIEGSDATCRRHTLAAVRARHAGTEPVVRRTRQVVEQMLTDLDEVIRKEDYRFRDEPRSQAERSAPARAVGWAAGKDGLVGFSG
jgi:uncharacterized protein DUF6062